MVRPWLRSVVLSLDNALRDDRECPKEHVPEAVLCDEKLAEPPTCEPRQVISLDSALTDPRPCVATIDNGTDESSLPVTPDRLDSHSACEAQGVALQPSTRTTPLVICLDSALTPSTESPVPTNSRISSRHASDASFSRQPSDASSSRRPSDASSSMGLMHLCSSDVVACRYESVAVVPALNAPVLRIFERLSEVLDDGIDREATCALLPGARATPVPRRLF